MCSVFRVFQGNQNAQVHQGQGPTAHYRETTAAEGITQFQKGQCDEQSIPQYILNFLSLLRKKL